VGRRHENGRRSSGARRRLIGGSCRSRCQRLLLFQHSLHLQQDSVSAEREARRHEGLTDAYGTRCKAAAGSAGTTIVSRADVAASASGAAGRADSRCSTARAAMDGGRLRLRQLQRARPLLHISQQAPVATAQQRGGVGRAAVNAAAGALGPPAAAAGAALSAAGASGGAIASNR
jgi:hypothetical protein